MAEILGACIPIGVGFLVFLARYSIKYSQRISQQNQTLLNNHLKHHEERLEPVVNKIALDVAYMRGWIDSDDDAS